MLQAWGTLGTETNIEGASSRSWTLRFERRLAPRDDSPTANTASSVWLVRDVESTRLYAAKRQMLGSLDEVDALIDEAAAWRGACLADRAEIIPELVDVFVERAGGNLSVTFLAEFCSRGLIPKGKGLSEAVLLTLVVDLMDVVEVLPSPHGHISYESLFVDEKGRLKLAGFGAHRSAILRDNPGLNRQDDVFDVGLLLFDLVFGGQPDEQLSVPESPVYGRRITDIIVRALDHAVPNEIRKMAESAGGEPRAPVVDVEKRADADVALPVHVVRATERNVEQLVTGADIGAAFSALLNDLNAEPEAVSSAIFKTLFQEPVSKDPVCAMRVLTMLHNLMLDGPSTMLAAVRKNDKFMDWTESSWTREAVDGAKGMNETNSDSVCFAGGELAFYSAALRRKAKFHMLAAGGFTGRWDRTGALNAEGRDVLVTRRRKVIGGMADLTEMFSELGCRMAAATDAQVAVKHASLGAMVSECCLSATAAVNMAFEVETVRDAQKVEEGVRRLHHAARALVFAVEHVPAAGGEQWVEQFASEVPPDVVANADVNERQIVGIDEMADIPDEGWAETEDIVARKERKALKQERKEKKKKQKEEAKAKAREAEEEKKAKVELTASDGAVVVHGAGDAAAAAVATMFGDLLSIDDGSNNHVAIPEAPRPVPNMSNAQALASAFGVPEEAVGGQHLALPPPEGFGDEDDEEGGYDNYRARQEHHQADQNQHRQVGSTAAWAARSGFKGGALVVSSVASKKKSHPVFCQCAICQQEETQAVAAEKSFAVRDSHNGEMGSEGRTQRYGHEDVFDSRNNENSSDGMRNSTYYDERRDSHDNDGNQTGQQPIILGPPDGGRQQQRESYYDDYDSYESVAYSVEDEHQPPPRKADFAPPPPPPVHRPPANIFAPPAPPSPTRFTLDKKLVLNLKRLRTGDRISDNCNIVVHKGEYNRETVAIKKIAKGALGSDAAVGEFLNEVQITSTLSHTALMKCIAASLHKPNYILVTELMKRGTLFDVLYKSRIKLTWALIRRIAIQIAEGMEHMHSRRILHRDLKSLNIFVDGSFNVKIGDFGLSRYEADQFGSGISGTYQYMAPEVLRGEPHSVKSDVYSFAQVLCEIISGTPPYQGMDAREVGERVVSEDIRPPIPMQCQRAYVNLIQICWGTVPATRPSFTEIVELIKTTTK